MENLEPWNMFTNDMIAEETDEILTDDLIAEYKTPTPNEQSQVKQEPEDAPDNDINDVDDDDDDGNYLIPLVKLEQKSPMATQAKTNINGNDPNDDAIFNFDIKPQVQIREHVRAPVATPPALPPPRKVEIDKNAPINFEGAVIYICPQCGTEFNAQDAWKRHINGVHSFNTRRGLNFIQLDKLYHECLECHKRIAMHSMENLLKHKFTHLPYRCTKCSVCLRQYKYRQDLMVHLRMTHREDLLALASAKHRQDNAAHQRYNRMSRMPPQRNTPRLEIKDIKENAVDIFENTCDEIEVRNELIEPDDDIDIDALAEQSSNSFVLPTFLEDTLSHSSSQNATAGAAGDSANDDEICEKYIQYICPQCGTEYGTQKLWRQHIDTIHDFGTRKGLNFREINMNLQALCLECNKVLAMNTISNLQQHKFSHLPHKSWLRCKLCFRACVGKKEIIKHLMNQHRLGGIDDLDDGQDDNSQQPTSECGNDEDTNGGNDDNQMLLESTSVQSDERDAFEPHIEYLCPQCGKEFLDKKMWRKHIVKMHQLTDLEVLNFKIINERQVICRECDKVITNAYGIQNAQAHRITHMPYKAFIRCRLCAKAYTDRKGTVKHLRTVHRFGGEKWPATEMNETTSLSFRQKPSATYSRSFVKRHRQKEIVQHANYTYEIQYLDDDDDNSSNVVGDDDNALLPELSFGGGSSSTFEQLTRLKCVDCGSIFSTQNALQAHIRKEHEFIDYHNELTTPTSGPTSVAANDYNQTQDEQDSNDDQLLVPTGDEEVSISEGHGGTASIDRNFCFLCPACGLEYKAQIEWRRHINEAHNFDKRQYLNFRPVDKFRHQCTICHDIVSNTKLKALQDHKFRHLPFKLYLKCLLCGVCYNHKPNMVAHLRMRHNIVDTRSPQTFENDYDYSPRPIAISSSKLSANSSAAVRPPGLKTVEDCISFHNAVDHRAITYFCPQCNENFDTHVFWRKHIVDAHNLNSRDGLNFRQIDEHHYLCLECYKRVTVTHTKGAIGQLQSHKFRHLPYKSFKCNDCNGEFVRKQMFFKHLNRATNRCDAPPISASANDAMETETVDEAETANTDSNHANVVGGDEDDDEQQQKREQQEPQNDTGTSDALILNQVTFVLVCPQCGLQYESQREWRQHINIEHGLGKRKQLGLKRLHATLHECLECGEYVNGNKLRDLQIHRFKHLPYGAYIQCKFCDTSYYHVRSMQEHLRVKHPNVVQKHDEYAKMEELQQYEEISLSDSEPNADDLEPEEQYLLG